MQLETSSTKAYVGDLGLIPGLGRSPGEGNANPLEYPCVENSTARGTWRATLHGVANSCTQLSCFDRKAACPFTQHYLRSADYTSGLSPLPLTHSSDAWSLRPPPSLGRWGKGPQKAEVVWPGLLSKNQEQLNTNQAPVTSSFAHFSTKAWHTCLMAVWIFKIFYLYTISPQKQKIMNRWMDGYTDGLLMAGSLIS